LVVGFFRSRLLIADWFGAFDIRGDAGCVFVFVVAIELLLGVEMRATDDAVEFVGVFRVVFHGFLVG
jgi:hypothetical protein